MGMAFRILEYVVLRGRTGATGDECAQALDLVGNSASARFSELAKVGCIIATRAKRRTKSGGLAIVYTTPPNPSFVPYLAFCLGPKTKKTQGLSSRDQAVLAAGQSFLRRWEKQPKKRSEAASKLLQDLLRARHLKSG